MGYYIDVSVNNVVIPADKVQVCLAAINGMHEKNVVMSRGGGGEWKAGSKADGWYSWVRNPGTEGFSNLLDALGDWRWEATEDVLGSVTIEYFTGEKYGDDELLFTAIAPYIAGGGAIEFRGEDGAMWRYLFEGGEMHEQSAEISWE